MNEDYDEELMVRRQLQRVEDIRKTLRNRQNTIFALEHRLHRTTEAMEKQRAKSKLLVSRNATIERENVELQARVVELESKSQHMACELARVRESEHKYRENYNNAMLQEEKHTARIRHLERHCAELSVKHTATCETNVELLREQTWLKTALEHAKSECIDIEVDFKNKLAMLQLELKEKNSEVFELTNTLRGMQYKYDRELAKLEKQSTLQISHANHHANEAHRVLEQREDKALQILRHGKQWSRELARLKQCLEHAINSRAWAFALLDQAVQTMVTERNEKPRQRFRRVALAVWFACSLTSKQRATHTAVGWRSKHVLEASLVHFASKLESTTLTLKRIHVLEQECENKQQTEQAMLECNAEMEFLRSTVAQAGSTHAALVAKLKHTKLELRDARALFESQQAEYEALKLTHDALEQDLSSTEHKHHIELEQCQAKHGKLASQLKYSLVLLEHEQAVVQQHQTRTHDLELELEATKEMLSRTKRYAEAEIASLSAIISKQ